MAITVNLLSSDQVRLLAEEIVRVYEEAFRPPPYNRGDGEVASFAFSLPNHTGREGFRLAAAQDERAGKLVGFCYGYTSRPGQWWHDQVATAMAPEDVDEWLMGTLEFVELAVSPHAQGNGIGGRLHDTLLDGVPHRAAVLSTLAAETVAYHMYVRRGWRTLIPAMYFPGVQEPYQIMGRKMSQSKE